MGGADLQDHMFQSYQLEWKKCSKRHMKLFKRLFNATIHNSMVIYKSVSANKAIESLTFRLQLIKGLVENHGSPVTHLVYGRPSTEQPPKRLAKHHFLQRIPATGKRRHLKDGVWGILNEV
jgi:hypothetical protein